MLMVPSCSLNNKATPISSYNSLWRIPVLSHNTQESGLLYCYLDVSGALIQPQTTIWPLLFANYKIVAVQLWSIFLSSPSPPLFYCSVMNLQHPLDKSQISLIADPFTENSRRGALTSECTNFSIWSYQLLQELV